MRKLLAVLLLVSLGANAAPSYQGFAYGAFIKGPSNSAYTVPNCTSAPTSLSACTTLLNAATSGNYVLVTSYQYSNTVAVNNVISMNPAAGAMLSSGGTETLVVSLGVFVPVTGGKDVGSIHHKGGPHMNGF